MKSVQLAPHPQFASNAAEGVEVAIDRGVGGVLTVSYVVTGDIGRLRAPGRAAPTRTDDLWKHTCFEVFLRAPGANTYYEFTPAPFIDAEGGRTRFELRAALDVAHLGLPADRPWRAGLSAVLEADDGTRAFWALAHPPGQPDFHHADAFALSLPPPKA